MNVVREFYRTREGLRRRVRELAADRDAHVLDVGCRSGDITHALAEVTSRVTALDRVRYPDWHERTTHVDVRFVQGDATCLPFRDATFDTIVSSECLQYVPDWRRALDEFHRVLRPEGRLVLTCPNGNVWTTWLDPYNVIHGLNRLLGRARRKGSFFTRHKPPAQILDHCREGWSCERFERRGTLVYIWASVWVENLQRLREALRRRGPLGRALGTGLVLPLVRIGLWIMQRDFALSLAGLSYNAVYAFRKCAPERT